MKSFSMAAAVWWKDRTVLLVILPILGLTSCQSAMSVEQAKEVTTSFSGTAFVPPPRTIEDITAILDQQKPADLGALAKRQAKADEAPPKTADQTKLANFYFERGRVAKEIGRSQQAIDDYSRAVDLGNRAGITPFFWLPELASAHFDGGDPSRATEFLRQALSLSGPASRGAPMGLNTFLVLAYLRAGDIDAAEQSLKALLTLYQASLSWRGDRNDVLGYNQTQLRAIWATDADIAQGAIAAARGQLAKAERHFRAAIANHAGLPRDRQYVTDLLRSGGLARMLSSQGRLAEAENEARQALLSTVAREGRYSLRSGKVLRDLAWLLAEQGRNREAEILLRAAMDINDKIGAGTGSYTGAATRAQLGGVLVAQHRWKDAMAEYAAIQTAFAADAETLQRYFSGDVDWAWALLETGDTEGARAHLDIALDRSRRALGAQHSRTAEIRGMFAMVLMAQNEGAQALTEFMAAIPALLSRSSAAASETTTRSAHDQRTALILGRYIGLLAAIKGTPLEQQAGIDATAEAFRVSEAARGRMVQRALDASATRTAATTPALADLVRRAQDAEKHISALEGMLVNAYSVPTDRQDAKVIESLRSQIATLRRAREALTEQIKREFPTYAALGDPPPITIGQARSALKAREALITTLVTDKATYVWAVPQAGTVAFATTPLDGLNIERLVRRTRSSLETEAATLGDIPAFDLDTAYELYRQVLEPVKSGWDGASTLFIVGDGALGQLPFEVLPTARVVVESGRAPLFAEYRVVPWLARRHAITSLPSVSALVTLRTIPASTGDRRPFVGFGDPYFTEAYAVEAEGNARASSVSAVTQPAFEARAVPARFRNVVVSPQPGVKSSQLAMLPGLPDTREEILGMARAMGADLEKDVFVGRAVNEQTVKALDLTRYRVVAFATHGLVPGDLDGLTQPALALSAPEVAKVGGDGLLTMEKILGLRLNADWVVLSACNTANGAGAGAEAISGLGRAFFYAGARSLLITHWPVETRAATALTTELFRRQSGNAALTRAKALHETMNWMIDDGGVADPATGSQIFSFAHPIFWAPFALVGDGG